MPGCGRADLFRLSRKANLDLKYSGVIPCKVLYVMMDFFSESLMKEFPPP